MRLVLQRHSCDCGVACVAMICGVSYERALAAFPDAIQRRMVPGRKTGTSTVELSDACERLGVRLGRRARPLRKRDLASLSGPMILVVRLGSQPSSHNWHWVAYDGDRKRLFDPAAAIEHYVVESYVPVLGAA